MKRRALLIAFHFPPASGSSGVHRTHSLARYLGDEGWEPIVLTPRASAHPTVDRGFVPDWPEGLRVVRTRAWDAARHFSIRGKYPGFLAWPDRWFSWYPGAVVAALRLIRQYEPAVIWSTYPIVTAQLIAGTVARRSGLPWVADLRDSMTDASYPPPGVRRRLAERVERSTVSNAARVVFTAPGTRSMYLQRYPEIPATRWEVIRNGYDEGGFVEAEKYREQRSPGKTIILHSGVIYPQERDPRHLFAAIARLQSSGEFRKDEVEIRLRASGHDSTFAPYLRELGIDGLVTLCEPLPYAAALAEMQDVDGLLLLQAANCNHQIPAKVFEYIRAGRPILALTDAAGDTAGVLREVGMNQIAPLDDTNAIAATLLAFRDAIEKKQLRIDPEVARNYSRQEQVRRTAELFDELAEARLRDGT